MFHEGLAWTEHEGQGGGQRGSFLWPFAGSWSTWVTAHQLFLSQVTPFSISFTVFQKEQWSPRQPFPLFPSAAQRRNPATCTLLINCTSIRQTVITVERFGSSVSHFFPRTLPWELLCTFILPCGGVPLITINKDRPGKIRTTMDSSKFTWMQQSRAVCRGQPGWPEVAARSSQRQPTS